MQIKLNITPFRGGYKVRFGTKGRDYVILKDALELAEYIATKAAEVMNG